MNAYPLICDFSLVKKGIEQFPAQECPFQASAMIYQKAA